LVLLRENELKRGRFDARPPRRERDVEAGGKIEHPDAKIDRTTRTKHQKVSNLARRDSS
jgi:hypothetical protein